MLMVLDDAFVLICAYLVEHRLLRRAPASRAGSASGGARCWPRTGRAESLPLTVVRSWRIVATTRELDLAGTDVELEEHACSCRGRRRAVRRNI